MSSLVITVKSEEAQAVLQQKYQPNANSNRELANALSQLFRKYASGHERATVDIQTGSANPVAASGTFTLDTVVATDVVVIGPVTLTGDDTPSGDEEFDTDAGSDALIAADLAAVINAHPTLSQVVTASAADDVVTITAKQKGVVGNFINISSPDATITASGSHLEGGTGGATEAASSYDLGLG